MYDYVKAVHIIFVVCYMAGLFYSVRLFIYHTEAQEKPEPDRKILSDQFTIMERKLWNIITLPSMIITVAAGITMLIMRPIWLHFGWMHLKLTFVVVLGIYHHMCQNKIKQMANGVFKWTSTQLRLWNELATLLLFAIVFLVVLKSALNWIFGVVGLVALAVILMIAVKIYKRHRMKKQ